MRNKIANLASKTQNFIQRHMLAIAFALVALGSTVNASAVDYDPAALTTSVGALFQGAVAIGAVIAATLIGIRVVKKGVRVG